MFGGFPRPRVPEDARRQSAEASIAMRTPVNDGSPSCQRDEAPHKNHCRSTSDGVRRPLAFPHRVPPPAGPGDRGEPPPPATCLPSGRSPGNSGTT